MRKVLNSAGRGPLDWLRIRVFKRLYHVMTEVDGMREHHKLLAARMLALVKEILKSRAVELVASKKLAQSASWSSRCV
jgi:hypothetical protein